MNKNISINLILSVILSVLLSGCGGNFLSHKYNTAIFNEQHKAVAVLKISVPGKYTEIPTSFVLVKLNDNYNDPNKREAYSINANAWFPENYSDKVAMISPGLYYIDYITWVTISYPYTTTHYTAVPGISKKGIIVYGAFEVKPGDVAYVGNLILKKNGVDFNLEKINELEQVKKDLIKNKQNDLSAKIKEIKFYNRGSIVHRNANGSFIIKNN